MGKKKHVEKEMVKCLLPSCEKMIALKANRKYCSPNCRWLAWAKRNPRVKIESGA